MTDQETKDRLAIRELADRYTLAVTRRDWDAMAAVFHEDARWITSVGHNFVGRPAIRAGISEVVGAMEFLIQMQHAITIDDLTADSAVTRCILNEFGRAPGGQMGVNVMGVYTDKVTKVDGRWGFAERFFQAHYLDGAAPPGMKLVDYDNQR